MNVSIVVKHWPDIFNSIQFISSTHQHFNISSVVSNVVTMCQVLSLKCCHNVSNVVSSVVIMTESSVVSSVVTMSSVVLSSIATM